MEVCGHLGCGLSDVVEHAGDLRLKGALHVAPGRQRQRVLLELADQVVALGIAPCDGRLLLHLQAWEASVFMMQNGSH